MVRASQSDHAPMVPVRLSEQQKRLLSAICLDPSRNR